MLARLKLPLLLGLGGLLLAAMGYWNIRPQSFVTEPPRTEAELPEADFYAEGSRTVQYQADGQLDYVLTSDRVTHLRATDRTLLTRPELRLYRGETRPWHVRSERGEVSPGGEEVELIDQVLVKHVDARERPLEITTSRMTVLPDKRYAQTRQAVRIVGANGATTATGMNAYLDEGRISLLSNVRGQHELR